MSLRLPNGRVELLKDGKWIPMMDTDGSFEQIVAEVKHVNDKYWHLEAGAKFRFNGREFEI